MTKNITRYLAMATLLTVGCGDSGMSGIEILCEQNQRRLNTPLAFQLLEPRTEEVVAQLQSGGSGASEACEEAIRIVGFNVGFVSATTVVWSEIVHGAEEDVAARQATLSADQELFGQSSGAAIGVQGACRSQQWAMAAEVVRGLQAGVREALRDRVLWCQTHGHLSQ